MKAKTIFRILPLMIAAVLTLTACRETVPEKRWENNDGELIVCVDAGHGYTDPGAMNDLLCGQTEKEINLAIALELRKILAENGVTVVMTREDDAIPADAENMAEYKLDPYGRVDLANGIGNLDLFVSIHCDSFPTNPEVRGLRVHYDSENTEFTGKLAEEIADACSGRLVSYGMPEAITKMYVPEDAGIYVLRHIPVPSVLVETGFISNEEDAKLMLKDEWRHETAQAIADGILAFTGWKTEN